MNFASTTKAFWIGWGLGLLVGAAAGVTMMELWQENPETAASPNGHLQVTIHLEGEGIDARSEAFLVPWPQRK